MSKPTIGIIGAGKLGIVLAQLATRAGYPVMIAGSGTAQKIALTISVLAPKAIARKTEEVAAAADVIILALPLRAFQSLDPALFQGKLLIDAMNYWWEVDGDRAAILPASQSSSEAVQHHFSKSWVVKAFSHVGYHDLLDRAKPDETTARTAIAVAGDNMPKVTQVMHLVDDLGFDALFIGPLSAGVMLEPGSPVFGAHLTKPELKTALESSFTIVLPERQL